MAMKDFDIKQFMLEKGERVGLIIAGIIGILLLVLYMFALPGRGFRSASAKAAADIILKKATEKDNLLNTNVPSGEEMARYTTVNPRLLKQASNPTQDPDDFRVADVFHGSGLTNTKRRRPAVYGPEEFKAQVTLAQVRSYMFEPYPNGETRVGVLTGSKRAKGMDTKAFREFTDRFFSKKPGRSGPQLPPNLQVGGAGAGAGAAGMLPPGGGRGAGALPGAGGASAPGGVGGEGAAGGAGAGGIGGVERQDLTLTYVTLDELSKSPGELAEKLQPTRMAIVVGSFPLRAQVEEFKKALRLQVSGQVFGESILETDENNREIPSPAFQFRGLTVQRRTVKPDGSTSEKDWTDIDLSSEKSSYVGLMIHTGKQTEPDDPQFQMLTVDGLVMLRPHQIAQGNYPKLEDDLTKVKEALRAIKEKNTPLTAIPNPRFDPKGFNPFSSKSATSSMGGLGGAMMPGGSDPPGPGGMFGPGAGPGTAGGMMAPGMGPGKPGAGGKPVGAGASLLAGGANAADETHIPEYCLLRFLDVTIEAGKMYEYRVQVRMANPNFGKKDNVAYPQLAMDKDLTSDWHEVKDEKGNMIRLSVPRDLQYYAVDQRRIAEQNRENYRGQNSTVNPRGDQAVVQVHRWIDLHWLTADQRNSVPVSVGDWTIAERIFVNRGEYLGQRHSCKLPVWTPENKAFTLATKPGTPPRARFAQTVEVSFGAEPNASPLLVDFEGGTQKIVHIRTVSKGEGVPPQKQEISDPTTNAQELLLLSSNGRLFVRHEAEDVVDEVRMKRHELWGKKVDDVEKGRYTPGAIFNGFGGPGAGGPGTGSPDGPGS